MVVDSLKKALIALGHGSASSYKGTTVEYVLKELAVAESCAPSVDNIKAEGVCDVLQYIADNKGSETKEPFDLTITATGATVTVERKGKTLSAGTDLLYNGDKLTITATAEEGKTLSALTVNGVAFTSGSVFTVSGGNVAVVATAS